MDDLVTWLRAQLDEDERTARAVTDADWREDVAEDYPGINEFAPEVQAHIVRHDPARVLREVEAKRRIVGAHGRPHECISLSGSGEKSVVDGEPWELWELAHTEDHGPCFVLRALALPYADRPGYRDEWRP